MRFTLLFCLSLLPTTVFASINIVTSIKPLQLILSSLTQGEYQSLPLLKPGASPHDYALRPKDIQRLQKADLFIWVGEELEPYFSKPLKQLPHIQSLALLDQVVDAAPSQHQEHSNDKDDHHHGHEHNGSDPHFWLGIDESKKAAQLITLKLIEIEPEKKQLRQKQLMTFNQSLDDLDKTIEQQLSGVRNRGYFVFHDAYGYFEQHYHLNHMGAFTLNPQRQPGAKQLSEIKQNLLSQQAVCVFSEPQFRPAIIESVIRNTEAKSGSLDPMATDIDVSPTAYFDFLQKLANNFETCLKK